MEQQNIRMYLLPVILVIVIATVAVVGSSTYWFQRNNQNVEKQNLVSSEKDPKQSECELTSGFYRDGQCFCKVNQSAYRATSGRCVARVDTSRGTKIIDVKKEIEKDFNIAYTNANLGFSLTVPQKWVEYKYYTEVESTYRFKTYYDGDLVHFYADFPDWEKFELMQIGRTTKEVWDMYKRNYESIPYPLQALDYWIGQKITETNDFVYYYNVIRQDAPNKYIEDGQPHPKISADFKLKPSTVYGSD